MTGPSLLREGQRLTTDATLTRDLRQSLIDRGVCPAVPTLREFIDTILRHGVTMNDVIEAIQFTDAGRVFVERDREGGPVRIGETRR